MPEQDHDTEATQTPDASSRQQEQAQRKADVAEDIEDNDRLDDDGSPIVSD